MKRLLPYLALLLIAATTHAYDWTINNKKWALWNRAECCLPLNNVGAHSEGVWFDFPVSPLPDPDATPPWAGYLITKQQHPVEGSNVVVTFSVEASEGVLWNFRSDGTNNPGNAPAAFRVYVQTDYLFNPHDGERWWSNPLHAEFAQVANQGVLTITVPIDPSQWSEVAGRQGDSSPYITALFWSTFANPTYVGLTCGGGSFFGKGVNVSDGTAKFTLLGWRTEP